MIKFICHLSTEDLVLFDKENRLKDGRPNCFVANKFDVEVDPNAIICNARRVLAQEYMNEITGMGQDRNFSRQDNSRQGQNLETQDKTNSRQAYCCQDNSRLSSNRKS